MKKKLIALLITVTMALSLAACGDKSGIVENADTETETPAIFERHRIDSYYSILVEKETGVCYLEYEKPFGYCNSYGITVMLNADGMPKIWEEKSE